MPRCEDGISFEWFDSITLDLGGKDSALLINYDGRRYRIDKNALFSVLKDAGLLRLVVED